MFFLYYNYGGCNDGDHSNDLEQFPTLGEAEVRREEILKLSYDATIVIIEGEIKSEKSN